MNLERARSVHIVNSVIAMAWNGSRNRKGLKNPYTSLSLVVLHIQHLAERLSSSSFVAKV